MTAALTRAEEAIFVTVWGAPRDEDRVPDAEEIEDARQVLSAALTDPDDPDWLAGVIAREQNVPFVGARQRRIAAAVRAAILGDAS